MKIRFAIQARIIRGVSFQKIILSCPRGIRTPSFAFLCHGSVRALLHWLDGPPAMCLQDSLSPPCSSSCFAADAIVGSTPFVLSSKRNNRIGGTPPAAPSNSCSHPKQLDPSIIIIIIIIVEYPSLGFVFRKISQSSLSVEALALAEDSPSLPLD